MQGTKLTSKEVKHEAAQVLQLSTPIVLQNLFQYSLVVISTAFVGHLGDPLVMSGVVLASSFANVTGSSILMGLAGAMDTMCGQAFGAKNFTMLGIVLQQATLILWLTCIPIGILWLQVEPLLLALGQPPVIAQMAARYLLLSIPALPVMAVRETVTRYLLTQRVASPGLVVNMITLLVSPVYSYLLLFRWRLGLDGAAYANLLLNATNTLLLLAYCIWRDWKLRGSEEATWVGLSWQVFRGWGTFLTYALPSTAMLCMEWWAFEVVIFMSGRLKNADVAVGVMGICFQICAWVYMFPMGIGSATNTRVANYLGAAKPSHARATFYIGVCFAFSLQVVVALSTYLLRGSIARVFSNSPEDIALSLEVLPFMAVSFIGDGVNSLLGGTLRAAGKQGLGAGLNLVGFWGLGLPLAWLFGFKYGMGAKGFWIGLSTSTNMMAVTLFAVISRFDWKGEVDRAEILVRAVSRGNLRRWAGGDAGAVERGGEAEPLLDPVQEGGGLGGWEEGPTLVDGEGGDVAVVVSDGAREAGV